jgi:hypothetical protein
MITPVKDRVKNWRERQKNRGGKAISVIISEKATKELEEFRKHSGFENIADLINQSISLLKWVNVQQERGYEIYAVPTELENGREVKKELLSIKLFQRKGGNK